MERIRGTSEVSGSGLTGCVLVSVSMLGHVVGDIWLGTCQL